MILSNYFEKSIRFASRYFFPWVEIRELYWEIILIYPNGFVLEGENNPIIVPCKYGWAIDHVINYPSVLLCLVCYSMCLLVNPHYKSVHCVIGKEFSGYSFCISFKIRKSSGNGFFGRELLHIPGTHPTVPPFSPCGRSLLCQAFQRLPPVSSCFKTDHPMTVVAKASFLHQRPREEPEKVGAACCRSRK